MHGWSPVLQTKFSSSLAIEPLKDMELKIEMAYTNLVIMSK